MEMPNSRSGKISSHPGLLAPLEETPYLPASAWRYFGMHPFTPFRATLGGILMGLATTLLWAANGRTAGISTIAGAIFPLRRGDVLWRVSFLVGLPAGACLGALAGPALLAEI